MANCKLESVSEFQVLLSIVDLGFVGMTINMFLTCLKVRHKSIFMLFTCLKVKYQPINMLLTCPKIRYQPINMLFTYS